MAVRFSSANWLVAPTSRCCLPKLKRRVAARGSRSGKFRQFSTGYARFLFLQINVRLFGRNPTKRRRGTNLASIEFAGRWSLLPRGGGFSAAMGASNGAGPREAAIEKFARVLLCRYGLFFRRLLDRESFPITWYELGRIYRRWEARGEIPRRYSLAE